MFITIQILDFQTLFSPLQYSHKARYIAEEEYDMDMKASRIGRNIKIRRIEAGMTQAALAEAIGVTTQQISNWERGQSLITLNRLIDVSLAFGIDLNLLLGVEFSAAPKKILRGDVEAIVDALSPDDLKIWVNIGKVFVEHRRNEQKEEQVAGQENV